MSKDAIAAGFDDGPAFIPYIVAGDPTPAATADYVHALVEGGADIVELGLPFSEPIADGPTIQNGISRALNSGMTPTRYLDLVEDLDVDVPIVTMTYFNLIHHYGGGDVGRFVEDAAVAGVDGLIVPDLPVEESGPLRSACDENDIALIFIVAPTTTTDRLERIVNAASGFVYVQARTGTTGAREDVSTQTYESLDRLPDVDLPFAVGFGVSDGEQAQAIIAGGADGVVAGSVFVDLIERQESVVSRLERTATSIARGADKYMPEPERT